MSVAREQLLEMYRRMVTIRRFEEKVGELFKAGQLPGWTHLCIGQEAGVVGACAALKPGDYMTSTHRGHGQAIAKGVSLQAVMAELMGRVDGCCRGRADRCTWPTRASARSAASPSSARAARSPRARH